MLAKLILLYCGFTQIQIPSPWVSFLMDDKIEELAIDLEMLKPGFKISYKYFLLDFYEPICLPPLKEVSIFDLNTIDPQDGGATWWFRGKAQEALMWKERMEFKMQYFPLEYNDLKNCAENMGWVYHIYNNIDDACTIRHTPTKRRRALFFVKKELGEKDYYNRRLPEPYLYLFK